MSETTGGATSGPTSGPTAADPTVVAACERLVTAYTHLVDFGRAAEVADLFTDDGVWEAPGVRLEGRAAIAEAFGRRQASDRLSRHVCTNLAVTVDGPDRARGVVYLTLYRVDGATEPAPLEGPELVGHYEDTFVRTDDGWRFAHRRCHVAFARRR